MKIASIIHASLIVHTVLNHIARNATAWLNINYKVINTNSKNFHHPQSYYHPSCFLNPVATTRSATTEIWSKKQQNSDSDNSNNKIKTNNSKKKKVKNNENETSATLSIKPIRINKVLKIKHSRRETDTLISKGLIKVNNKVISLGCKVIPYKDKIKVNGVNIKHWEQYILNDDSINDTIDLFQENNNGKKKKGSKQEQGKHEYIKYWKPKGVQCSIDPSVENNILQRIQEKDRYTPKRRIFPVGYLDRDTSGKVYGTYNYFNSSFFY